MKAILLTSSVLILAVILLRFLFRRTVPRRVQYALWLLVLLRLLIPVSLPAMRLSVLSAAEPVKETRAWGTAAEAYERLRVPRMSYTRAWEQVTEEARRAGEDLSAFSDSELEDRAYARMSSGFTLREGVRLMWYVGMGFAALLFLLTNLRFARKLRRTRVPLEGAESRYPVYLCDDIPSPCLFGLGKPAIYVTSPAARDPETLRYVIAHEEAHARHLDSLWTLLRSLCLVIWWFDPLVWLAARLSKIDCELACDESVLEKLGEGERVSYGETLLRLVPLGRGGSPMLNATTMTAGKRQMKDRIKRIAEHKKPLLIALVAVLVLAALVCACTFTGAKQGETPEPTETLYPAGQPTAPSEPVPRGEYESPEAYVSSRAGAMTEAACHTADTGKELTVPVLDRRWNLQKLGELSGLAPKGTLELYNYLIELRLDAEPGSVLLVGGMSVTEDGWYDLEGKEGRALVLLRREDGSVTVLHDSPNNDDMGGLYRYEETPEEMLYDWYVMENELDLPLYTIDLLPQDEGGNHPARRYDGEGWYIYIPIPAWEERSGEGVCKWVSKYGTGSSLTVREASREELTAERPRLTQGQAEWYIEGEDGRLWLVFARYIPENITNTPEIDHEPLLLEAMAESFTVPGGRVVESQTWGPVRTNSLVDRLWAAADRFFGTYGQQGADFHISVEAEGRRDEYLYPSYRWATPSVESSMGYRMKRDYTWTSLEEGEAAALDRNPAHAPVLRIWTEEESFTFYAGENVLEWIERDGTEHWLRPEPLEGDTAPLYDWFLGYASQAEASYRPYADIGVPGTVTDYAEVARQVSEQYAAILTDRPGWYAWGSPDGAGVLSAELFDAYYGEDYPNFCFVMRLAIDVDGENEDWFQAGPGLGAELEEGPYAGWRPWWAETTVGLVDGTWRLLSMGSGGATVWLPYGLGWDFPDDRLTTEQLTGLYFLTSGNTHDWRLLRALAQKPTEELRDMLESLPDDLRRNLLEGMADYNERTADWEGDRYGSFDLEALG